MNMIVEITLGNGEQALLQLSREEYSMLEREAAEIRNMDVLPSYSAADELAAVIRMGLKELKRYRGEEQ